MKLDILTHRQFDNIETFQGWSDVPSNYSFLDFQDFLIFKPSDAGAEGSHLEI